MDKDFEPHSRAQAEQSSAGEAHLSAGMHFRSCVFSKDNVDGSVTSEFQDQIGHSRGEKQTNFHDADHDIVTNLVGSDGQQYKISQSEGKVDSVKVLGTQGYENATNSQTKTALHDLEIFNRDVAHVKKCSDEADVGEDFVDKLSNMISGAIARDSHIGDVGHPTAAMFADAIKTNTLDQVINQTNQKLWKNTDLHADLYVEEGKEVPDTTSKRITLMTSHSGRILGQTDIFVRNSDIEPTDPRE